MVGRICSPKNFALVTFAARKSASKSSAAAARCRNRGLGEQTGTHGGPEQSQVRSRRPEQRSNIGRAGLDQVRRRRAGGGDRFVQPLAEHLQPLDVAQFLHPEFELVEQVGDDPATAHRELATDEVGRLDAVRPLVDRSDPRIAVVLRDAGLLDVPHPAVDLHCERRRLVHDVGTQALRQRNEQVGELTPVAGVVGIVGRVGTVERRGVRVHERAHRIDPRRAGSSACGARRGVR